MNSKHESKILFRHEEIETTIKRLATEIQRNYKGKYPLLIGVLKGSFIFLADLVRQLDFPLEVEFLQVSSYGKKRTSQENINFFQGLKSPIEGREVLIVEDIIDTGRTTRFVFDYLFGNKPASLQLCALIDKPSRRQVLITVNYLGFTAPDEFLVGYGLDYDEKYRNLPDIYILENK